MRGPSIAIDAAMLAAAIGVDGLIEGDIRRCVFRNDAARLFIGDRGGRAHHGCFRFWHRQSPFIDHCTAAMRLKAGILIGEAAPALDSGLHNASRDTVFLYSIAKSP